MSQAPSISGRTPARVAASWKRLGIWAAVIGYLILLLGPTVALILTALEEGDAGAWSWPPGMVRRAWPLLGVTLRQTLGAVFLAVLFGLTVATAIHRSRGVWRRVLSLCCPVPLLLPPAVVAVAWTHLLGRNGIVTPFFRALGLGEGQGLIYSDWGTALVLGSCWFPLVALPACVGLRARGPCLSQAGRLYSGPWLRRWRLDLPLLLPYVSAGACCVAWLALGDFDVPTVFLRNAFPIEIYAALQSRPELGKALIWSLPLLALALVVLVAREISSRNGEPTLDTTWRGTEALREEDLRASRLLRTGAVLIFLLTVALPLGALVHQTGSWAKIEEAFSTAGRELINSFYVALAAATLSLLLGWPYARILNKARGWRREALAAIALIPLILPPALNGLGWIAALQDSAWGRSLLATPYVLALASAARFFPLSVFVLAATQNSIAPRLDAAARLAGAGRWQRWRHLTWPLIGPGLLAAFALCFAFSAGELGCAILLQPPGYATLPVRISSLLHFGKDEWVAALCLAQAFLALIPYAIASVFMERDWEVRLG